MDEKIEKFSSLSDLYKKIFPALNIKSAEFKRERVHVLPIDIWNYCLNYKWKNKKDLRIYEIVDDILNLNVLDLEIYLKKI